MKTTPKLSRRIRFTALGVLAAGLLSAGQAQTLTNIVISKFDGTEAFNNLFRWWGLSVFTTELDTTVNNPSTLAPNVMGSGSLKCTTDWAGTSGNGGGAPEPQLMIWNALAGAAFNAAVTVNGYYYDLNFDLRIDPASAKTVNGDYGHLQAGVTTTSGTTWKQVQLWDVPAYAQLGWKHIHLYIDPAVPGVDAVTGFYLYWPWQTDSANAGAIHGPQTFWVDNIIFSTNLTKPIGPPTATLKPVPPAAGGLNITSSGAAQYDRNNIASLASESWVNASGPVTYSLTIAKYPSSSYPNYQTHIMLVPNPGTEASPDWNEANCILLDIENQGNGSATATLRYKTNQPGGNSMLYNAGALGSVTSTNGGVGTWSMTFLNNTSVVLQSPDGNTRSASFPDEQAIKDNFPDAIIAYFGAQPNAVADIGQGIVLSNVKITGTPNPINDSFFGPTLDTSTWVVRAAQPANVFVPASDAAFVLSWTLPDSNFILQVAPSLAGPWTDPGLTNTAIQGSTKSVTVPWSALPSTKASFFRFVKPLATKLQVLMPGETAAPGTASGRTGTPTAQTAGVPFNVTVNAVDNYWNLVNYVTDVVAITSSDSSAALPLGAALAKGTQSFSVTFGATGSFTVTATDVTDSNKTANTGSATPAN